MNVRFSGRRMSAAPPLRSKPVRDRDKIKSLIVVAAATLNSEKRGRSFTFRALIARMRALLERGRVLDPVDVRAALEEMGPYLTKTWRGWRWKRGPASSALRPGLVIGVKTEKRD